MKKQKLVYIHGGETFDDFLPGVRSTISKNIKKTFTKKSQRWPDNLNKNLPEFEILKLKMPGKYNAKYEAWKKYFEGQFASFEDGIVLLGWSLGANFLAKYLSENKFPFEIKALHLVAGCYGCSGGFGFYKNLELVSDQCEDIHLYHSEDDFVVNIKDLAKYQKALPQARSLVFKDRNHFLQADFPELAQQIRIQIGNA